MKDFRYVLADTLAEKQNQNPAYSLRHFARDLSIEPGFLSKLIRGKRRVTAATAQRLGVKLKLPLELIELYKFSARSSGADTRRMPSKSAKAITGLEVGQFEVMSDWYHFAILELTKLPCPTPSPEWAARCLGISVAEAQNAVKRLLNLKLLKELPNGRWVDAGGTLTTTNNKFTNLALKKHQKQILELAASAVDKIDLARRSQSAITVAVHSKDVQKVKEKIQRFRRQIGGFLERRKTFDSVYNLSISFYPVTENTNVK